MTPFRVCPSVHEPNTIRPLPMGYWVSRHITSNLGACVSDSNEKPSISLRFGRATNTAPRGHAMWLTFAQRRIWVSDKPATGKMQMISNKIQMIHSCVDL